MNSRESNVFLELSFNHLLRSHTEKSDESKLMFLLAGCEAIFRKSNNEVIESKDVVDGLVKIIEYEKPQFSRIAKSILWKSYTLKNKFSHGATYNNDKLKICIPQLQLLLRESLKVILRNFVEQPPHYIVEYIDSEVIMNE